MATLDLSDRMEFLNIDGVVPVLVAVSRPLTRAISKQEK
jgi:hypothetical protein